MEAFSGSAFCSHSEHIDVRCGHGSLASTYMKAEMQNTSFGVLLGEEKREASHQRREEINRESKKDGCRKAGVKSGPSRNMFSLLQCFSKF